jgi:hypothetical protein
MATTAEHIEGITDAGKFEVLATRVLRLLHEDCRSLVHLGTNAEEKTIPSPIDGFHLVPGSEPHRFVMSAFTTSGDLKRKWLFDGTAVKSVGKTTKIEDGDLVKAAKSAEAIRATDPEAKFILYLCTNRSLGGKLDLMNEVYAKAQGFGISVVFLEQSILRDFLDTNADGQWLRQEHLGITADRPSFELLRDLARKGLEEYRSETQIGSLHIVLPTASDDLATAVLHDDSISLLLLTGPSGAGKSVVAQTALAKHLQAGNIGLRVPGEVAERASSLHEALASGLRSLHGHFDSDVGRSTLEFGTSDRPLLVVIDDINRTQQPTRLLEKIIGWSRPSQEGSAKALRGNFRIICPVWEAHAFAVQLKHRSTDWIQFQIVQSFLRRESIAYLNEVLNDSTIAFGPQKLEQFAEILRDDPILLGLFAEILLRGHSTDSQAIARNVIGHYVEISLAELAGEFGDLAGEYNAALRALARELLLRKTLRPDWEELGEWFPPPSGIPPLLKKILTSGKICRTIKAGARDRFDFRHDRILEHFLAEAAGEVLSQSQDPPETFADPYFVPYLGKAITLRNLPASRIDWLVRRNPVALIAGLRFLPAEQTALTSEVMIRARSWLADISNASKAIRNDAFYLLTEINSPHVLTVTDGLALPNPLLWEARLRNGDAFGGAQALSLDFYPAVRHAWLEALIRDAKESHGPRLVTDLGELLSSGSVSGHLLNGALCLAGYLADPALADSIALAWKKWSRNDKSLVCFLWAAFRCGGKAPRILLDPMMQDLLAVDDNPSQSGISRRDYVLEELSFSARHSFPESILRYLTELGEREEFRWIVASLIGKVDHPVAVVYMVKKIAERQADVKPGHFFPYASHWRDWWQNRSANESGRLSGASLDALHSIWRNSDNPAWLQEYSFQVWARYTGDIPGLREVEMTSPLSDTAIRERVTKGDSTVAAAFKAKLQGENWGYWLQFIRHVWRVDFEDVLDGILGRLTSGLVGPQSLWSNNYYAVANALRDIPPEPAERLLLKHWPGYSHVPLFIQTALYLSTDESRKKAAEALARTDPSSEPFSHLDSFFGFNTYGLRDRITIRHIESLKAHIPLIDGMGIYHLIEWCHQNNLRWWALENLQPACARRLDGAHASEDPDSSMVRRAQVQWFPKDEDIWEQFNRMEGLETHHYFFQMERLFDDLVKLGEAPSRFFELLENWVTIQPSIGRRNIALAALQVRGTRIDLSRLRVCFRSVGLDAQDTALENVTYIVYRRALE